MIPRSPALGAAVLVIGLGIALADAASAAGLTQVRQTIFGMDCAPCAHGVEKSLSEIEGVEDVTVSLNDGYALIGLEPDNPVTLEQIRTVIRDNGFTPKEAAVFASGTIKRDGARVVLATGAGPLFTLVASSDAPSAWRKLETVPEGATVAVDGIVAPTDVSRLSVVALNPVGHQASTRPRSQR